MSDELILSVSEFVAVFNQTIDFAYPSVTVVGELSNFRVSKNKWVYFDLKDDYSSVKFFGTIYMLPGPLEDGIMVQVDGSPRLHQQFGFSINARTIRPVGEGSLKKAAALLEAKLAAEGLFDAERKRSVPYPPKTIGLIASGESAAYHDFLKILSARWSNVSISHYDVQVQGEAAVGQITAAISYFNAQAKPLDALVITRGGGSADDLAAFSTEQITRAVAASRIPTVVAIGHEIDISLSELAADVRASTPSNAAELLVPDKQDELRRLASMKAQFSQALSAQVFDKQRHVSDSLNVLAERVQAVVERHAETLRSQKHILALLDPQLALKRGYAYVQSGDTLIRSVQDVKDGQALTIHVADGTIQAEAKRVE